MELEGEKTYVDIKQSLEILNIQNKLETRSRIVSSSSSGFISKISIILPG